MTFLPALVEVARQSETAPLLSRVFWRVNRAIAEQNMIKRFLIVSVLVVAVVGGIGYYKLVFEPNLVKQFIAAAPRPTVTVSAEAARSENWRSRVQAIGSTRAAKGIEVASEVSGRITSINFNSGEDVAEGVPLVQLDDSLERADLKNNLASLKGAQFAFDRQNELFLNRTASKAAFDDALAARDSAAANVEHTQAAIDKKLIKAPFSGRLGLRLVDVGQYVSPGTPFVALHALDPIYVDFPIPEQDIAAIKPGQEVEVTFDAFPSRTFSGQIESIDSRVSAETRTMLIRASLPNPEKILVPGMFANVSVLAGDEQTIVTVPRTAVNYSLYGDTIYVLVPESAAKEKNGEPISEKKSGVVDSAQAQEAVAPAPTSPNVYLVERRTVKTGATIGDRIQVVEGIKEGELVATSGQNKLQNGIKAAVNNDNPLSPQAERPRG